MTLEERVQSPGAILAVWDHGGEGEPVLLLHGGPGVPDYLEPVAEMLVPLGLRPVRFDQRGSGGSVPTDGRFGPLDHVADVEAVRAHVGIDRVHVFGHSWGGLLAQLYLAQHPEHVRSLFLSSPAPGVGLEWRTTGKEVFAFNGKRAGSAGGAAMGLASLGMKVPPIADRSTRRLMARVWRNYYPDPRSAPPADAAWLAGIRAPAYREASKALGTADPGLLRGIGDLDLPVLVEFGGDDIYLTAAEVLRRRFPNAKHETLAESGHLPWLQDTERFRALLAGFYSGGS